MDTMKCDRCEKYYEKCPVEKMHIKEEIEKLQNKLTYMFLNSTYGSTIHKNVEITKVIFNNPATIVFWSDGKKTFVKCAGDEAFDEEKGLAIAISKRVLGNHGNYYNEFKKWLPKIENFEDHESCINSDKALGVLDGAFRRNFVGDVGF